MRQDLLGIVLAVSFGLNASAMAATPVYPEQSGAWELNQASVAWLNHPLFQNSARPSDDLNTLALAPAHQPALDASGVHPAAAGGKRTARVTGAGAAALNQGMAFYKRGYIAKAIPSFERAVKQAPQSELAFLWLAKAYQKQGGPADVVKAKAAFQKTLSINPNNVEALSSLGEYWSWDPALRGEAITLLKHAYDLEPRNAGVSRKLAEALFWQGDAASALGYARPITDLYKNDKKWMGEYAQMLSATGHADDAMAIYNHVLKDTAGSALDVKMEQARSMAKLGQKENAQSLYRDIVASAGQGPKAKNPDFIQAMSSLAFDIELYDEALRWDQTLPNAAARQKEVQLRDARALARSSRIPEAIDGFNRLYESGLLTVSEKLEYAEYLRLLHLPPESLPSPNLVETLYQEANAQAPDSPEVALRLGRMYAEQENQFDNTVKSYQLALSNPNLSNRLGVQKELLDYLKTDKTQPDKVEALFQQMLAANPNDAQVKFAYAEYLSWQPARRAEALKSYVALAQADPDNRDIWEARIEEVLKWHTPTTDLIPVYQEIVNVYPKNKTVWLAVARAYRNDKDYYKEAVDTYGTLVKRYPDDGTIKREWLSLLLSRPAERSANIKLLKKMSQENPGDLDVLATYGKLLSYDHQYGPAMDAFQKALSQNPEHREALIGKGYVILWSGNKLEAKQFFTKLRRQYPDDVDIAIGLAQSDKLIGRYDEAYKIIQEIKPLMDKNGQKLPESGDAFELRPAFLPVENLQESVSPLKARMVSDVSPLPAMVDTPTTSREPSQAGSVQVRELQSRELQSEVDSLSEAVKTLQLLQKSSRTQLDRLGTEIQQSRDAVPGEMSLTPTENANSVRMAGETAAPGRTVGEAGMTRAYGTFSSLDYDTNPLMSGVGRLRNDDLEDLEKGLTNELRPMIRGGFQYSTQDGNPTTNRLRSWGFPNQLSLSLTPQVRIRGGIQPNKYYLPNGVSPDKTWGVNYGIGATVKYWDRLTLDGDLAITHFTQSKSANLTTQVQAQYDFNDSIRGKIGFSRLPLYNSLLSVTGLRPSLGAFRNDLVGQVRENSIYGELNTNPFNHNWDWNLGYSWAFVDGSRTPTNHKNQAFTSLGYTWHYAANHQVRLGYEFLYFGYGKNATNGYFDTTAAGVNRPVVSLRPVTLANSSYVFGGYYSPVFFMMNAGRLDFRGSLFNKFIEYKLGGSLGAQTARLGHGIHEKGNGTTLSKAFDANVIMNFTDWLAAYGDVDFLDAGGQFNRWRFGGGLIVRPHIDALSPLIGQKPGNAKLPEPKAPQAAPPAPQPTEPASAPAP